MSNPELLLSVEGDYHSRIDILEDAHVRFMRFGANGGRQGAIDIFDPKHIVITYQRVFACLVRSLLKVNKFLSLGVGIGTSIRTVLDENPSCQVHGVDIDSVVLDLAFNHFGCPNFNAVNYVFSDGFTYLQRTREKFDLIFVDEYTSNSIDESCLSSSFITAVENVLTDSGVAVCNIASPYPFRGQAKKFINAVKKTFPLTVIVPLGNFPCVTQNVIVVFTKNEDLSISLHCQFLASLGILSLGHRIPPLRPRIIY